MGGELTVESDGAGRGSTFTVELPLLRTCASPREHQRSEDPVASAVRLLGTELILTGIRAEVSRAMSLHGADLKAIVTRQNLQSGVAYALKRTSRTA
jgi:hypothetical protein